MADTGCGVSPDDKEKLFLPYFSTKDRGTGLGLAIVSHIVAEHNAQHPRRRQSARRARASPSRFRPLIDAERTEPRRGPRRSTYETAPHAGGGRRAGHPPVPERRSGGRGLRRRSRRRAAKPACSAARSRLRAGAAGYLAARHRRPGNALPHPGDPVRRAARGGRDLRPRHHRNRREGHQARRFRFSREAALHRQGDGGGEECPRAPQPGDRKQPPARPTPARATASSARASP